MKLLIFLLFSTTIPFLLSAQPSIQWQTTLGGSYFDEVKSINQTKDKGYILVALTASDDGDVLNFLGTVDFWVIKLDNTGQLQWQKTLGGDNHDWPYSIKQTPEGGYIVAGLTESNNGDVSGQHGDKDAWVVKLDPDGNIEWQKALGGTLWDEAWSIQNCNDGGYIMAGWSSSKDGDAEGNPGGFLDYWIVKLTSNGDIQWQKAYGGSSEDTANSIKQTSDGGYIVTGKAQSSDGDVIGNNGNVDIWILKLDSLGNIQWQNAIGGEGLDQGTDIFETTDGYFSAGFAASGNTGDVTGFQGFFDFWVAKLSKTGDLLWQKSMGGTEPDWLHAAALTPEGDLVIAGATRSTDGDIPNNHGGDDVWIIKLDKDGQVIWQKTYGGTSYEDCFSINATSDGGLIFGGFTWSTDGDLQGMPYHDYSDVWVAKLAPDGASPTAEPPAANYQIQVFPNPASEFITITADGAQPVFEISIFDAVGKKLMTKNVANGSKIPIKNIPIGIYAIIAKMPDGAQYSLQFAKSSGK